MCVYRILPFSKKIVVGTDLILKTLKTNVITANNGDLECYEKCKLLISVLIGIYVEFLQKH